MPAELVARVAPCAGTCDGGAAVAPPLCVDLDGTLLRTEISHEQVLLVLRRRPRALLSLLRARIAGKAAFKRRLAEVISLDLDVLPLNEPLIEYLVEERAKGRELALLSAADDSVVQAFADRLRLFDWAQGSQGRLDLVGAARLIAIRGRYPARFAYAGDGRADLAIWGESAAALVAGRACRRVGEVERIAPVEACFPYGATGWQARIVAWAAALRLHQWAKNSLLFVPVLLAGPLATPVDLLEAALGCVIFGLLASAGYVINDLLDLDADRRHGSKRRRPFASGALPIQEGLAGSTLLVVVAVMLSCLMPLAFAATAVAYFAGTLSYSLVLKREPLLDVLMLAGLFTLRVLAGAMLLDVPLSFWLLTFSMFLFLSLGLAKRYAELYDLAQTQTSGTIPGRGYSVEELPLILTIGVGTTIAANIIFVVYTIEEKFPSGLYSRPSYLWLVFPILAYWTMRLWRLAVHGRMNQDPVLFALRDRLSLVLGALILLLVLLAR